MFPKGVKVSWQFDRWIESIEYPLCSFVRSFLDHNIDSLFWIHDPRLPLSSVGASHRYQSIIEGSMFLRSCIRTPGQTYVPDDGNRSNFVFICSIRYYSGIVLCLPSSFGACSPRSIEVGCVDMCLTTRILGCLECLTSHLIEFGVLLWVYPISFHMIIYMIQSKHSTPKPIFDLVPYLTWHNLSWECHLRTTYL